MHKEGDIHMYIQSVVCDGGKECYLFPYLDEEHWQLIVICPRQNLIVFLCSLWRKPSKAITRILDLALDAWHLLKGKRSANRKKTTWICPHAQKQTGNTECGFYVMRHMLNIVWATITDSWNERFTITDPFSQEEIKDIRIPDRLETEKGQVNVTENVEVNVDETVQLNVNEGETVWVNDGESVQVNKGEIVPLNEGEEGAESDTGEDSVRGIHFDDSKEERAIGYDDGFRHDEVGQAEAELNERLKNMKRQVGGNRNGEGSASGQNGGRGSRQQGETSGVNRDGENDNIGGNVGGFAPPDVTNMHTMKEEYERDGKPRYPRLHKEDIKVGGIETFRINTLIGMHRCGRVFNNKNANSIWIAKVVVDKFRTSSNVKLFEIIEDVRKNYSVGVGEWKAWKARQYARNVVDGDASQQYTFLWDYNA
ncbi:Papain-like cysteine peptidase superfamily [Sesbania bispinosa]|nr:Papain-like cysteine peptidase superfamily [Sesbania bispinosa]